MKNILRFLFAVGILVFTACDANLDLQKNPNAVTPEKLDLHNLYNSIQLNFAESFRNAEYAPGQMVRMYHMGSFTYESAVSPATLRQLWTNAYANLFPDIKILIEKAEVLDLDVYAASAKIMKAYVLLAMVDNMGDIPLFEIGQGTDIISPKSTSGAEVYAAANELLGDAITQLAETNNNIPITDNFYDGDAKKWATFAKTLQLRIAVNTRLINPTASKALINSLVAEGDLIDEISEDFAFKLSANRVNPDSRHWMYRSHYETGDGDYLSNYYMWLLRAGIVGEEGYTMEDPRTRYYFYRQTYDSNGQDPTIYSCHFSTLPSSSQGKPDHFDTIDERLPYCTAWRDGYIGRDHGNGSGVPPDGPFKTSYGLYPGGGQFDENSYKDTRRLGTTGGKGQGIYPIMLSSFVDFLRAESALTLGTNDNARALLESGMRKSISKVKTFESLVKEVLDREIVVRNDLTIRELYTPTAEDIDEFVAFVLQKYDAANAERKLDILMKEYYKALWGNGLEAYNMYRRTGKPANMQPTLEPAGGNFVRSFYLPDVHVNRNGNATQKEITDLVFWDDGSAEVR